MPVDSIHLVGDPRSEFRLPWVRTLTGDLVIADNPDLTTINAADLVSVSGDLDISNNPSVGLLDLGSLQSVTGDLEIINNDSLGLLDLGSVDFASGNLTITGNGSAAFNANSEVSVSDDLTIETTGTGLLALGDADVGGNLDLTIDGYTVVNAATAGGSTGITMINQEATMEVTLPGGTFMSNTPVAFSISNQPASMEIVDGNSVIPLSTYAFEFAIPTLNSDAELNFEIDLTAMNESRRQSLLDLLHGGAALTLAVRGDEPGSETQLFDVCPSGGPAGDSCVSVQWLDQNREQLDPQRGIDPSIVRLEGIVGHFSTYSFVVVGAVPEPSGLVLLLNAAALGGMRRNP